MSDTIKKIIVVGGGTAGWLSAGIIAAGLKRQNLHDISIALVESPDVATIGVGEGTWPTMRTTLKKIGISETEFIKSCSASFKQGSKFVGWRNGASDDQYYHPFTLPVGNVETRFHRLWQHHFPQLSFDQAANAQSELAEFFLAPKQISTPEYAGVFNYGYHLDAGKFSALLNTHCVEKLGVSHIRDHVVDIVNDEQGYISTLKTKEHGDLQGDFFIDCSGSKSIILGEHFSTPFVQCNAYSPNDRAMAIQVPYGHEDADIASATVATAQSAGWTWDIGLSSRRGVGYVYSSAHINDDDAEKELRAYILKSVAADKVDTLVAKKITINAGHRQNFWVKNCVAVGMSAGFIEPLEASALALVELSANFLRDELPLGRSTMPVIAKRFNRVFHYRWQRIIEFLKLHYVLSQRDDTSYWRDVREPHSMPEDLRESLAIWAQREPYFRDFIQAEEIFPSASYQYVLYGMGFKTQLPGGSEGDSCLSDTADIRAVEKNMRELESLKKAMPANRELLGKIHQFGLQKV